MSEARARQEDSVGAARAYEIRTNLRRLGNLPTLPQVVTQLLDLVENPNACAKDIGEAISRDQSMAASILRLVNSPFYGLSRRIHSIQEAVVLVGLRTIRNMALSTVLMRTFGESSRDRRFDRARLWRHTVAVAVGSKILAKRFRTCEPEEAFLTGLVHEIGLVILDQNYHEEFCKVLDLVLDGTKPLTQAERTVFGLDHAEVGGVLAQYWRFPPTVTEAIACHHSPPSAQRARALAAVVHLGSRLEQVALRASASGPDAPSLQIWETDPFDPTAFTLTKIAPNSLALVRSEFEKEWKAAQAFLSSIG